MKWIIAPLLWLLAVVLAVAVLWRLYRGKNIVLRGKWSPRVIRTVAILLVALGVGATQSPAAPEAPPDDSHKTNPNGEELPTVVSPTTIKAWSRLQDGSTRFSSYSWQQFKLALTQAQLTPPTGDSLVVLQQAIKHAPPKLAEVLNGEMDAVVAKKDSPRLDTKSLMALYDELEPRGFFDHWLNARLWRKTAEIDPADATQLAEVYARMLRHARLTDTLIQSYGEVRPYTMPARAWMSKAGPRASDVALVTKGIDEVFESAKKVYPATDSGTWKRDGVALITVAKDSPAPTLWRAGRQRPLAGGDAVRFGRLDLLQTPDKSAQIDTTWLGRVVFPANRTISVWHLPGLLSPEAQATLKQSVRSALEGDENAADNLELALPFTQSAIRAGLADSPNAKLAPRMRLLLALFDDTVLPVLTENLRRVD